MEVSGQFHSPADLPPWKEPLVPVGYEARWAPEPFWTRWWREWVCFVTASRTALGPIQPPIQWIPGALSLWGEAAGAWN